MFLPNNLSTVLTPEQGQHFLNLIKPQSNLPFVHQVGSSVNQDPLFSTMTSIDSKFSVFSSYHNVVPISSSNTWMIDTRASDHLICSLSLFTTITAQISTQVKLPNGKFATITHIGTAQLFTHLILTNVLYISSFSYNLLSVSKFIKSITCFFLLFANSCFILSLPHWVTIGVGRAQDGLYCLLHNSDMHSSIFNVPTKSVSFPTFSASVKNVFFFLAFGIIG
jgi:hypothetical protein